MRSQRVGHHWETELRDTTERLNWTEPPYIAIWKVLLLDRSFVPIRKKIPTLTHRQNDGKYGNAYESYMGYSEVLIYMFCSVQLLSCVWLFATPWTAARQASLSISNSWSPPKAMSVESVMPSNHVCNWSLKRRTGTEAIFEKTSVYIIKKC